VEEQVRSMNVELRELVRMSRALGADAELTQGGGGNTSAKTVDGVFMYIKASGSALATMQMKQGWRRLRLDAVQDILRDPALNRMAMLPREQAIAQRLLVCCDDDKPATVKPSIEAHFHSLLDRYTAHLHPMAVGPYICCRHGQAALRELFHDLKRPVLWLDYADLGYMSAKKMLRGVRSYEKSYGTKPRAVFLQKHGLVITGASVEEVLTETARIIKQCWKGLGGKKLGRGAVPAAATVRRAKKMIQKAGQAVDGIEHDVRCFDSPIVRSFLRRDDAPVLAQIEPLVPHELSYAHGMPIWVDRLDAEAVAEQLHKRHSNRQTGYPAFLVPGAGLLVMAEGKKSHIVKEVIEVGLMTRMKAVLLGGTLPLSRREQDFLYQVYIR